MKKILILVIGILILNSLGAIAVSKTCVIFNPQNVSTEKYDMVIISPNMFNNELQPLIDHKNSRNVLTILKTTEDIYNEYPGRDKPEQIKYFIKDALDSWDIKYVLLVGGANQLPGRYTHIYFEYDYQTEWIFLSDLYYADIYDEAMNFSSWDSNNNDIFGEYNWSGNYDELDLYPDVFLGRLARVPPQGPFKRLFAQRAMGQKPKVSPRTQSPQAAHLAAQRPASSRIVRADVFTPG